MTNEMPKTAKGLAKLIVEKGEKFIMTDRSEILAVNVETELGREIQIAAKEIGYANVAKELGESLYFVNQGDNTLWEIDGEGLLIGHDYLRVVSDLKDRIRESKLSQLFDYSLRR